jgi:hypothetical protein
MSKVVILQSFVKRSFPVTDATITTGWMPGQGFKLNTTGDYAELGSEENVMFVGADDDDEVASPPSGSLVTGLYGAGTTIVIDHSEEVAASSADRAYAAAVESGAVNDLLYFDSSGKFTTAAPASGSAMGIMFQKPAAANDYGLGVILRF